MIILTGWMEKTGSNSLVEAEKLEIEVGALSLEATRLEKEIDRYRPIGATYPFEEKYAESKDLKALSSRKQAEAQLIRSLTTESRDGLIHELQKYIPDIKNDLGCQTFAVTPDNFNEGRIWLYSIWNDESALKSYLEGPFLKIQSCLQRNGFSASEISKMRAELQETIIN